MDMSDQMTEANLTPEEKTMLRCMVACSRASYNEAIKDMSDFVTGWKGDDDKLWDAIVEKLTKMTSDKKSFDWEIFRRYYNDIKPFEGSDTEKHVDNALAKYPEDVKFYKEGAIGLIGKFMGEVMKTTKGEADPKLVNTILRDKLKG